MENHIKLLPKLREVGKSFLKSVFQMLVADRMLANSEEMMSDANYALGHPEKDDKWRAIEYLMCLYFAAGYRPRTFLSAGLFESMHTQGYPSVLAVFFL